MQACVLHKFLYSAKVVFERRQSLSFMPAAAFLARTLLRKACKGAGKQASQLCSCITCVAHIVPCTQCNWCECGYCNRQGWHKLPFLLLASPRQLQPLASCSPCQSSPCQVQLPLQGARCKRSTCCKSTQPPQTTDGTLRKFDARLIPWDERNAPRTRW